MKEHKDFIKKCIICSISLLFTFIIGVLIIKLILNENLKDNILSFLKILRPILYGMILAYILKTPCNFIEQKYSKVIKKDNKTALVLSITTCMIIFISLLFLIIQIIVPQLINTIPQLIDTLIVKTNELTQYIEKNQNNVILIYLSKTIDKMNISLDSTSIIEKYINPHLTTIISTVTNSAYGIIMILKDLLLAIILSIYMLYYKTTLGKQAKMILYAIFPQKIADHIFEELVFGDKTFNGFLIGKVIDSTIIGVITYICLSILKMPYTPLVSVIVGLTNIIPVFGPIIGAIPSIVFIFVEDPMKAIVFSIFIIILQQIDGHIIGPKLIGDATGISIFWVLCSIIIFGGLFGIFGMIIGVPIFGIIYDIIRKFVKYRLDKKHPKI